MFVLYCFLHRKLVGSLDRVKACAQALYGLELVFLHSQLHLSKKFLLVALCLPRLLALDAFAKKLEALYRFNSSGEVIF